ncbi:MAG: hypothetical protein CMO81_09485 [Waddliaceae bacterium]|nr:hypothetical protein [Waddliaceae bacterium]
MTKGMSLANDLRSQQIIVDELERVLGCKKLPDASKVHELWSHINQASPSIEDLAKKHMFTYEPNKQDSYIKQLNDFALKRQNWLQKTMLRLPCFSPQISPNQLPPALYLHCLMTTLEAQDINGYNRLHQLIRTPGSSLQQIEELLKFGLDANLPCKNSKTAMHLAVESSRADLISALYQAGGDINATDKNGDTPLHQLVMESYCTHENSLKMASTLLALGADTNRQNKNGDTPLHIVCQSAQYSLNILTKLLKHKANPNIQNKQGNTPLHFLVNLGPGNRYDQVKLLINAKAQVNIRNKNKNTPIDECYGGFHCYTKHLLKETAKIQKK